MGHDLKLRWQSRLADLALHRFRVDLQTVTGDVANRLERSPDLPGVIIEGPEGTLVGTISRQLFFRTMSHQYAIELFSRKPIAALWETIRTPMLVLPADCRIDEAAPPSFAGRPRTPFSRAPESCTHDGGKRVARQGH